MSNIPSDISTDLQNNDIIDKLNNINQIILASILICTGLIICFFGGKYAKKLLFLIAFTLGSLSIYLLIINFNLFKNDTRIQLFVSCGIGIIIAFICIMVYRICIFTTGAISGVILAQLIWQFIISHINNIPKPELINTILVIVMSLICGLLAFKFVDIVLRIVTPFIGGFMVTIGVAFFVEKYINNNEKNVLSMLNYFTTNYQDYYSSKCDTYCFISLIFWFSLFILGCWYQYGCNKIIKKCCKKNKNEQDYQHLGSVSQVKQNNNNKNGVKEIHIHHYHDRNGSIIQGGSIVSAPYSYELEEYGKKRRR